MKKDDLFKYFLNQKNVRVFSVIPEDDCCHSHYYQIMNEFNCAYENIFEYVLPIEGDYLVTDDSIGLKPNFLILYPEGNILFFTLIE